MALFLWQHQLLCAGMLFRTVFSQSAIPGVSTRNAALYSCTKKSSPLSHCSNELIPLSMQTVFKGVGSTRKKKRLRKSLKISKWAHRAAVRIGEIWELLSDKATCSHKAPHASAVCRELFCGIKQLDASPSRVVANESLGKQRGNNPPQPHR